MTQPPLGTHVFGTNIFFTTILFHRFWKESGRVATLRLSWMLCNNKVSHTNMFPLQACSTGRFLLCVCQSCFSNTPAWIRRCLHPWCLATYEVPDQLQVDAFPNFMNDCTTCTWCLVQFLSQFMSLSHTLLYHTMLPIFCFWTFLPLLRLTQGQPTTLVTKLDLASSYNMQ